MYVSAVTLSSRWPTNSPIRAHGTPRRCSRRDPPVAQVVRRHSGIAGGPARLAIAVRSASAPRVGEQPRVGVAILARPERRLERVGERRVQLDPERPAASWSSPRAAGRAGAARRSRRRASSIARDACARPVEQEQRQPVLRRQQPETASTCSALGGLSSSGSSRGSLIERSRAGFGSMPAWSSVIAPAPSVLRIVSRARPERGARRRRRRSPAG